MISLTKWALKNRAAVILLIILSLGFGTVSYFTLPKEFMPAADNPMVTVIVMKEGADAGTIAEQATEPIEQAVGAVKGKTNVFSSTSDGFAAIDILFDANVDMKEAKQEVQEAVEAVSLPEGYSRPVISQLNIDMIPLWQLGISFPHGLSREAMETVEQKIVPKFESLSGIANVSVYGKQHTQVKIKLDQEKLKHYQIPVQALISILQGKNLAVSVGEETIENKQTNIKVIGEIEGTEALKNLQIAPNVQLQDVASVEIMESSSTFFSRVNGEEAVALLLMKEPSANAVAIGKKVEETIDSINEQYGPKITMSLLVSFSNFIVHSVNSLMQAVLLGALFAAIVIFLFLKHLRMTMIAIISIPLSLGITLLLLSLSGVTLNILTIGAVAVAVGRLVDDSIVVIENIFRKAQNGNFSKTDVLDATKEVAAAITSSTLTTVAVFLPMGLAKSLQDLLLPFALTITYALLSSLLVALIVVPLMSSRLLKTGKLPTYKKPKRYVSILNWCLNHKWLPIVLSFVIFAAAIGAYFVMPKGSADASDSDIQVSITYPDDIPFSTVKEDMFSLESYLQSLTDAEQVILFLGMNPEDAQYSQITKQNSAQFYIVMKQGANAEKLIQKIEKQKENYPQAVFDVMKVSFTSFQNETITLDIIGRDPKKLLQSAELAAETIKEIEGVERVATNQHEVKSVYEFIIDQEKANAEEVAKQMELLLNPFPIGTIKLDGKDTPVLLDSAFDPESENDLNNLPIIVDENIVPLSSVAKLKESKKPTNLLRKNGSEYIRLTIEVDPANLSEIAQEITNQTNALKLPEGYSIETGGAAAAQSGQFAELFQLMAISIGLVYLIMVLTFKTLRAPLVILFTLPLAVIGSILGIIVSRMPIDIGAMIGALLLIGIVVTNAIVLLDRVRQNEKTMTIREALLEASATRFRPIVMTALATIFAMIPLLFGKEEMGSLVSKGLAVVVIGGLSVSTLLTLIVIPAVYELFHFRKAKKQRLERKIKTAAL